MSTSHSEDWHEGHAAGYERATDDTIESIRNAIVEGKALGIYTYQELWAAVAIHHDLELHAAGRAPRDRRFTR